MYRIEETYFAPRNDRRGGAYRIKKHRLQCTLNERVGRIGIAAPT